MSTNSQPHKYIQYVTTVDGITREEEVTVKKQVRTSELIPHLQSTGGITTPILPQNCVMYAQNGQLKRFLLQVPPVIRQLQTSQATYEVAIPSLVYRIDWSGNRYTGCAIFMSKDAVESSSQTLFSSMLPNQYGDGRCCEGSATEGINMNRDRGAAARINTFLPAMDQAFMNDDLREYRSFWPVNEIPLQEAERGVHGHLTSWARWTASEPNALHRLSTLTLQPYRTVAEVMAW